MKISLAVFGVSVLLFFSCNEKVKNSEEADDINQFISQKTPRENYEDEKAFVIEAVDRSYALIEIAEIAQLKGSQATCSQATALKDGQISILYNLIDFADMKSIELPEAGTPNEAAKSLYADKADFEKNWHQQVRDQNEAMIKRFESFRSTDKNLTKLTGEILKTLRFNRTILDDYIAESN
jgi:hypothetical protein